MIRKVNRLNEELARWAFEIIISNNTEWEIAFTNPTAGPWKTVKAHSLKTNKKGEVYRFILEEDRPDIIIYNDKLKSLIIFEAKDNLEKLLEEEQSKKSANVVVKLAGILSQKGSNPFWSGRENYKVIVGLLWGSVSPVSKEQRNNLFNHYHGLVEDKIGVEKNLIVGIETLFSDQKMICRAYPAVYGECEENLFDKIMKSLI